MPKLKKAPGEWGSLQIYQLMNKEEIKTQALKLLEKMDIKDKIGQMSGDYPLYKSFSLWAGYRTTPISGGENPRLGIPGIRFTDGPRGVFVGNSTCFPVSMGRAASWDLELEERVGDAIGTEARALGANFFGGVCINLLRHPAWGRAQETYGEDPYLLGEMGAALIRGVQRHIMACVKHFALNTIEDVRHKVDVKVDERTLHEIYLPHFKRCVDEGVAAVMSAYNKVNGNYCGHNKHLLRDILKEKWGFEGFVMSDFVNGIFDAKPAILAGLDIEMPNLSHYHKKLKRLVKNGEVLESLIDEAVLRLLQQKLRFAQIREAGQYNPSIVANQEHRMLAREAAVKSIVLLKNQLVGGAPILPMSMDKLKNLTVIGKLADIPNIGDHGSSSVHPPYVITPLNGIQSLLREKCKVVYDDGTKFPRAAKVAQDADAVVMVVGYSHKDEGEKIGFGIGGDRTSLRLHPHDEKLIQVVVNANPRSIVVLMGGGPIITETWRDQAPAILMVWYPGMEGGHALADVLFGQVNPSGKLPCGFPKSEKQLPFFDRKAASIEYGYYHGYRLLDKQGEEPAFPFGFGLSYTSYEYKNLQIEPYQVYQDGIIHARVDVTNTGQVPGEEIVQLYVGYPTSSLDRPVKELKGFKRIRLAPGHNQSNDISVPVQNLAYYDVNSGSWKVEPGQYKIFIGSSSSFTDLLTSTFKVI